MPSEPKEERRSGSRKNFEQTSVMVSQEWVQKPQWQKNMMFVLGLAMLIVPPALIALRDVDRTWVDFAIGSMMMFMGGMLCFGPVTMLRVLDRVMRFRRKNGH